MTQVRADESYRVALPEFEGPLDLLLHLCKTHELEIVNIPIAFITEKYLEYLDVMQSLSVDVAADYLVMAATLAYLKARELVPTPEAPEAAEEEGAEEVLDPREELIRRLLEYQKYKNAAALLGDRPIEGRNIFGRGMEIEGDGGPAPLADHSAWKLIEAFGKLLEKAGPKIKHEVIFDRVSISARINQVVDRLEMKGGALRFDELFDLSLPEAELRSQLVVTLLAMLELARLRVVRVLASDDQETLIIAQVEGAALDQARRARLSSDAESVAATEAAEEAFGEDVPTSVVEEAAVAAMEEAPAGEFGEDVATSVSVVEAAAVGVEEDEGRAAGFAEDVPTAVVEAAAVIGEEDAPAAFAEEAPTAIDGEDAPDVLSSALESGSVQSVPGSTEPGSVESADRPHAVDPATEESHEET